MVKVLIQLKTKIDNAEKKSPRFNYFTSYNWFY